VLPVNLEKAVKTLSGIRNGSTLIDPTLPPKTYSFGKFGFLITNIGYNWMRFKIISI
jgi:hypothetical protein